METNIYDGLEFTTKEINQNFIIKVHSVNKYGKKLEFSCWSFWTD